MNYNDILKNKLIKNIKISLTLFALSLIYLLITLYQLLIKDTLAIQSVLLLKDYIPIFLSIHGLLAVLCAILIKEKFDSLYPHQQVQAFFFLGVLFLPFNAYLIYIGIQKYQEKSKYHKSLIFSILIALTLIISLYTLSITQTKDIKAIYLNEYVIEGIYQIDEENYITLTVTGVARGRELQSITYDASFTMDAPDLTIIGTEFIQLSMNVKQTCIVYAFTEAQDNHEMSCVIDQFTEQNNRAYTLDDFTMFEDLYVEIGQIDLDMVISITNSGAMTILSKTMEENVYDKYN
jgi:hypothetical protein